MWCTNPDFYFFMNPDFYGIRTPTFTPYEPFLFRVGVVFNMLTGDPTKHFSVKRKGFSVKRGEGFSE